MTDSTDPSPRPAAPKPDGSRFPFLVAVAVAVAIIAAVAVGLALTSSGGDGNDVARIPSATDPTSPVGLGNGAPPPTGETVPDVELELWDGDTATLSDFAGKPLVVNFWASWCAPCVAEMPDLEKVHEDLGDQVKFLGVNRDDSRGLAEQLADETGVTYPLATDTNDELVPAFKAVSMPTTVFIDENGVVVRVHSGGLTEDSLRKAIAEEFGS